MKAEAEVAIYSLTDMWIFHVWFNVAKETSNVYVTA
jgi:hypothetical protein